MKYYSSKNKLNTVSFKDAVLKGIADDGGLYLPVYLPKLPRDFFSREKSPSFQSIAFEIARNFTGPEIPEKDLAGIIEEVYHFDAPLVRLDKNLSVLELFHGPTLAFKDFGARFMARIVSYLNRHNDQEITILVATSGDTGSAVAHGFYNQKGIKVILLYPSGMVSDIQEKQLTTLTGNITSLEVLGTFDDCQSLVKKAFLDEDLKSRLNLSSANSINIARLIPQSFYYVYAFSQLTQNETPLIFSVPSGNLGNLTAGLFAKEMGLPIYKFVAALNVNDVFMQYLTNGIFKSKKAIPTLSNAMDVGNPSNFARIESLYQNNLQSINNIIFSRSFTDEETKRAIFHIYSEFTYIMDPHGAVGYLALMDYLKNHHLVDFQGIILETAHPAKFCNTVEEVLSIKLEVPAHLKECLGKQKRSIKISKNFSQFRELLLEKNY